MRGSNEHALTKLQKVRQKTGLSRAEACKRLEIPYSTWRDWEQGLRKPPKWAEALILEKLEQFTDKGEQVNN